MYYIAAAVHYTLVILVARGGRGVNNRFAPFVCRAEDRKTEKRLLYARRL